MELQNGADHAGRQHDALDQMIRQLGGNRLMRPPVRVDAFGFQQISELKPINGIDLLGPLPSEVQKVTIFSAGIVVGAEAPNAGKALIAFLASPAATKAIMDSGLEPIIAATPASPTKATAP